MWRLILAVSILSAGCIFPSFYDPDARYDCRNTACPSPLGCVESSFGPECVHVDADGLPIPGFCVGTGHPDEGLGCETDANCGALKCGGEAGCVRPCADRFGCGDGVCLPSCGDGDECEEGGVCHLGVCLPDGPCVDDDDCFTDPRPGRYRYVLLEDLSTEVSGNYPGADIDAIILEKANGDTYCATTIEEANIAGAGNGAADVYQALGSADANCSFASGAFVSMGGLDAGAYLVVSFGTDDGDVAVENGDVLLVVALDSMTCDRGSPDLAVTVGSGTSLESFKDSGVVLGAVDAQGEFPVKGL